MRYVEKHYAEGDGSGENIMNPTTVVELDEGGYMEMETTQIKGVDSTVRTTTARLGPRSTLIIKEKVMTHGKQLAKSDFTVDLDGEGCHTNVISRSVARGQSRQVFLARINGNAACYGHSECDAIIMDEGVVSAALTADRLAECDLVIVALYPQAVVEYVSAHRDHFRKGGVVMDCGGVKGVVCTPLADVVKDAGFWFVGGHPMAGIERSGYGHAFPELFQGASLILTPYPGTPRECLDGIWELARRLGFGHLQLSTPEEHDHIIAYTSQLAHVVSCAYVGSPLGPQFRGRSPPGASRI